MSSDRNEWCKYVPGSGDEIYSTGPLWSPLIASGNWTGEVYRAETPAPYLPDSIPFWSYSEEPINYGTLQSDYVGDLTTHMDAQPSPEPISTPASNSVSNIEKAKQRVKELFELPVQALKDPENETSMKDALSILADDPSLVSKEQEGKILELLLVAPTLMHNWRENCSTLEKFSQKYSAEMKKFRDAVENSVRDEEILKVRQEQVENKKKELMKQLEAVQKEKAETAEQRIQKSKNLTKQEAHRNKEEDLMGIATTKLKDLSDQWAKIQKYFFI